MVIKVKELTLAMLIGVTYSYYLRDGLPTCNEYLDGGCLATIFLNWTNQKVEWVDVILEWVDVILEWVDVILEWVDVILEWVDVILDLFMLFMWVFTRSHKYRIILSKAQNWLNRIFLYPHKFLALRYFLENTFAIDLHTVTWYIQLSNQWTTAPWIKGQA